MQLLVMEANLRSSGRWHGEKAQFKKLPRPTFSLDMIEGDWAYSKMQWKSYVEQAPATPAEQLLQLRAACEDSLLCHVYQSGDFDSVNTVDLLSSKMKLLAVRKVHRSRHMINMWNLLQSSCENVRAFAARITAIADICDLKVPCTTNGCTATPSYRDEAVMWILIKGLHSADIQSKVLVRT